MLGTHSAWRYDCRGRAASQVRQSVHNERRVLRALELAARPLTAPELRIATGLLPRTLENTLQRLMGRHMLAGTRDARARVRRFSLVAAHNKENLT